MLKKRNLTEEEKLLKFETIKSLWEEGLSNAEIARRLDLTPANICIWLDKIVGKNRDRKNVPIKRKYTLNQNYFEKIDSEDKAYFLGLLYSDGCMSTRNYSIQIAIQEQDKNILEKFSSYLETNKPLKILKKSLIKGFKNLKKVYYRKHQCLMVISSKKLYNDLSNLGLTSNKSLSITFPTHINQAILHHFIRGIFDGDGGIYLGIKNRCSVSIAGNPIFLKSIQKILEQNNIKMSLEKHYISDVYYCRMSGRLNCIDFYNYLYKDSTIYLQRKYDKFQECINLTKSIRNGNTWKKER